jgi:hypothetical protein
MHRSGPVGPPRGAGRRLGRVAAAAGLVAALATGCSSGGGDDSTASTTTRPKAAPTTTEADDGRTTTTGGGSGTGSCPGADDVGEVLGGEVRASQTGGGSTGIGDNQVPFQYTGCGYRFTGTEGRAPIERLSAEDTDDLFAALDEATAAEFESDGFAPYETDLGDDSYREGGTLLVKDGPVLVVVEAERDGEALSAADTEEYAAPALDLTYEVGTEQDCDEVGEAVAGGAEVQDTSSTVGSRGADDVQIDTVGCQVDLADGTEVTVSVSDSGQWDAYVEAKQASTFVDGYRSTTVGEHSAFDTGSELVVDDGDEPLRITTEDLDVSDEVAAQLRVALAELALGD